MPKLKGWDRHTLARFETWRANALIARVEGVGHGCAWVRHKSGSSLLCGARLLEWVEQLRADGFTVKDPDGVLENIAS